MSLDRAQIERLIPHAASMCLLDEIIEHSPEAIRCESRTHRDPHHPLRRDGELAAVHLIEYGAQAAAAHGALLAGGNAQPGMLAALREITFNCERVDTFAGRLSVTARRRVAQQDGALYEFQVQAGEQVLCAGRIAISFLPPRAAAGG